MFYLRTGTPGSGKTLSLIDELRHTKDRPIYYYGIPELSPELGWHLIDHPKDFHNQIPDGAIFVLDECQQHFPVRPPKDPVPPAMAFIETHRHRGIDIYFITQHPSLLDHHARRLVGHHTHLQRNFGMPFAVKYTNNKLFDATQYHELIACQKSQYRFPKEVFKLYKSAEVHTHKVKLPKKLLLVPLLLALFIGGIYTVYNILNKNKAPQLSPVPGYQIDHAGTTQSGVETEKKAIDWATAFTPKIQGLPYTAPIYKALAVPVTLPVVAGCLATPKKCQCYTQQATKVDMSDELCRMNVKNHQFNPFREPREPTPQYGQQNQTLNTSNSLNAEPHAPIETNNTTVEHSPPLVLTEFDFDQEAPRPRSFIRSQSQPTTTP